MNDFMVELRPKKNSVSVSDLMRSLEVVFFQKHNEVMMSLQQK